MAHLCYGGATRAGGRRVDGGALSGSHTFVQGINKWTLTLVISCVLIQATWIGVQAQENDVTQDSLPGPCKDVTYLCKDENVYGDPENCNKYYECDITKASLIPSSCPDGTNFDYDEKDCLDGNVTCTPSCDEQAADLLIKPIDSDQDESTAAPIEAVAPEEEEAMGGDMTTQQDDITVDLVEGDRVELVTKGTMPTTASTPPPPPPPTMEVVKVVNVTEAEPPYIIVTVTRKPPPKATSPQTDSTTNSSVITGGTNELKTGGLPLVMIAIIAAVAVALIILIVILVIIVVCIIRRRRRQKHDIVQLENPIYRTKEDKTGQAYRFSRDSNLLVGKVKKPKGDSYNNNAKKKSKAPPPPVRNADKKRKAPPPPNPFTGEIEDEYDPDTEDLYEKDTEGSEENVEMTSFITPVQMPNENNETETLQNEEEAEADIQDPLLNKNVASPSRENESEQPSPNGSAVQPRSTEYSSSSSSSDSGSSDDESPKPKGDHEEEKDTDQSRIKEYDDAKNPFLEG